MIKTTRSVVSAFLAPALIFIAATINPLFAADNRHKYGIPLTEEQRAPLDILEAGTFERDFEGIQIREIAANAKLYGQIPATYRIFINSDNLWVWGGWEDENSDSALLQLLKGHKGPVPISDELLNSLIANIKGHLTKMPEYERALVSLRAVNIILSRDPSLIPQVREQLIVQLADLIAGPRSKPNAQRGDKGISIPDERKLAIQMVGKYGLHAPIITESVREATKNRLTEVFSRNNFSFIPIPSGEKFDDRTIERYIRRIKEYNTKVAKPALAYLAKHGSIQDMQAFRNVIDLESWKESSVPEGREPYMGDFGTSTFAAVQLKALAKQCGQECVAGRVIDSVIRGFEPWEKSDRKSNVPFHSLQAQLELLRSQLK